jgi:hypothetical protein
MINDDINEEEKQEAKCDSYSRPKRSMSQGVMIKKPSVNV